MLLILSAEERDAAAEFIERRFKLLREEDREDIQSLLAATRTVVTRGQAEAAGLDRLSRMGKLRIRVYQSALAGLTSLAAAAAGAAARLGEDRDAADDAAEQAEESNALLVPVDASEISRATDAIRTSMAEMSLPELQVLTHATTEIIGWWSSDRGQVTSLHLHQHGNIGSAAGRMAIRKAREDINRGVIMPLRKFFQELNVTFQKRSRDAQQRANRGDRSEQKAGPG